MGGGSRYSWMDTLTVEERGELIAYAGLRQREAIARKALESGEPVPYSDEWFDRFLGPLSRESMRLMLIDYMRALAGLPPVDEEAEG